jgi:LemA protein
MNLMFLLGTGGIIGIVIAVIAILLIMWVIGAYNRLVQMRNKVRNGWSQIDVQLKRRFDLIPNLAETVKGYANLEKGIFEEFARARGLYAQASKNGNVEQAAEANASLGNTLSRLLVVTERYPELKANSNFQEMMAQLKETEDKIPIPASFTMIRFRSTITKPKCSRAQLLPECLISSLLSFSKLPTRFREKLRKSHSEKLSVLSMKNKSPNCRAFIYEKNRDIIFICFIV